MFKVVLILLLIGTCLNCFPLSLLASEDPEWDALFGHLSGTSLATRESSLSEGGVEKVNEISGDLSIEETITAKPKVPPAPPAPPFVFDVDSSNERPNIGTNTYGSMEGIAISQNRGISVGLYIVNSTYNSFTTTFGNKSNRRKVVAPG